MDTNVNTETNDHLGEIYEWIDQIKFSRPKKNIARDFSDGGKENRIFCSLFLCRNADRCYDTNPEKSMNLCQET
jgi:hypothetical protein